jgi:hypothetical protein
MLIVVIGGELLGVVQGKQGSRCSVALLLHQLLKSLLTNLSVEIWV